METRTLVIGFGANTIQFSEGIKRVKNEMTGLNVDLLNNKKELSTLTREYNSTEKSLKLLSVAMKMNGDGTQSQKEEFARLSSTLDILSLKVGEHKATQQALKSQINLANKELKDHQQGLRGVGEESNKASKTISTLGTALKALVLGYTGKKLFDYLIGSNSEMEQYITSFETMLGSASKAKALMNDLVKFAGNTPMSVEGSTKNAELLMNYGLVADDVINKMTKLGDLSKGNEEKMGRVSMAYGQMLAKGKVTGEELRQMTEAGVPLLQALAASIGVSTAQLQKMISAGKVGIPELDKAIESLTTGTGKFAGMMEKQSKSMNGMLSSLKDEFQQIGRDLGEEGFVEVKEIIGDVLTEIRSARESGDLSKLLDQIGSSIGSAVRLFTGAIKVLWEYKDVVIASTVAMGAFKGMMAIQGTVSTTVNALKSFKVATDGVKASTAALNVVMVASSWMVVAALVAACVGAYALMKITTDDYASAVSSQSRELKKMNEELERSKEVGQSLMDSGTSEIALLQAKTDIYEGLRTKVNKTAQEHEALKTVAKELQELLPDSITLIDKETGAYLSQVGAIEQVIAKMRAKILLSAKEKEFEQAVLNKEKLEGNVSTYEKSVVDSKEKAWLMPGQLRTDENLDKNGVVKKAKKNLEDAKKQLSEATKIEEEYKSMLEKFYSEYPTEKVVSTIPGDGGGSPKTSKENPLVTKSKKAYEDLRFLRDADLINESEYLTDLTSLRDSAKKIDEDLYRKYYLEVYNIQKSSNEKMLSEEKKAADELSKIQKEEMKTWVKDSKSSYDKYYKDKIDKINAEVKAEENRINKLISAIDDEIKARRRLKEETDSNKEIDAVKAKLQYAQLDDFSRMELEKELAKLQEEKGDRDWTNKKEDEKEVLKDQLTRYKEIADQQKQLFTEEKERMNEMFEFISENFSSLSELQTSGIVGVFDVIKTKTAETADMYSTVVGNKVQSTFDYAISKAREAIQELNAAVAYTKAQASSIIASANKAVDNTKKIVNNNQVTNINNQNLSSNQVAEKVMRLLYPDPFSIN